jgi:ubiquinone/menaquinone biosynthesis C-methylase UbiE
MLNKARIRFATYPNVMIEQADVEKLPYKSKSFGALLSLNGLHAFPGKDKALSEMARVLKPKGCLVGCSYVKGENKRSDFIVNAVLAPKGWFTPPFWTKEELGEALRRHWSKVEVQSLKSIAVFHCVK